MNAAQQTADALVMDLAMAAGHLVIATDGDVRLRPERLAVRDALRALRDEWRRRDLVSASGIPLTRRAK